ncbi:putative disease resistance protein At3g14460 [Pistacia vera]|uniref:putative disease resistance protein At3g14460 n=1 Tax=Pistacia vera TaxID=55513 RepID=UPI001263425D|nr:putative disease resistance protein At3g14460 [Pistacia vera]
MEKLTCLRTLQEFAVSDNTKACSLDCLQHLNNLHYLGIKGLGYLRDVGEGLKNNQNLLSLDLYFEHKTEYLVLPRINENDKVILEALQPPPNLKKLNIQNYAGSTLFPNWMVSLTNLRVLSIDGCVSIEHLPSLGKLSSLEVLKIRHITKVKSVGNEILGIKSDDTSAIAFPKLKSLTFSGMWEWEEWDYEITKNDEKDITIMPCLRFLHMICCPQLKGIPNSLLQSSTLEKLELYECPILQQRCEKERGDYWAQISRIRHIEIS